MIKRKKTALQQAQTLVETIAITIPPKAAPKAKTVKKYRHARRTHIDSRPSSQWYEYLHDNTDVLGITRHGPACPSDISVCTLNTNSLSEDKLSCILPVLQLLSIDILVLTDTRHRESTCKRYTSQVKLTLGPHAKCIHLPVPTHLTKKGSKTSSVGGQMVIISPSWAGALIDHFQDPSHLGLVSGIRLSTGEGSLLIMGNYWPYPSAEKDGQHGLWAQTAHYLHMKKIKKSPKNSSKTSSPLSQIDMYLNLSTT